ncbi:MAG: CoB--CoM heterodisulfide reductase iron-sulfur subunit A family protein [Syntrophobacteraceae bacterium]|nr:CoB--CoM heterodisulfide reductase iron-sulfur subunit A family protein [Syntrophobacteraceae bacterium]
MLLQEKIGAVMVVGGGIAGIQAALDLANSGYYVYLVERSGAIGGAMAKLAKTFPTNDSSMCILSPKLVECGRHLNIELKTLTEVVKIEGEVTNFTVTLRQHPRYVDTDRCIACAKCSRRCPREVKDEFNERLGFRKAIYILYPQAVPLKYQVDPNHCDRLLGGNCRICEEACPAQALLFNDQVREYSVRVGSIIMAPGYRTFDPRGIATWGYGIFPNVITSIELERYLSASGPTGGRLFRPSDHKEIKKLAFLQCVGSRDYTPPSHGYCSSVCCMSAIKEAMIAMERVKDLEVSVFYMDMRTHGKDFERYYQRARARGVKFHRCRVHSLEPVGDHRLYFRYITDEGKQEKDEFDVVVLSVGMESPPAGVHLANLAGVELNHNRFVVTSSLAPVTTSRPGIFVCGAFSGLRDIPQAVVEASAAAGAAAIPLTDVRYNLWRQREFPPERDVSGQEPRIGVFLCHCGSNIAGVIDMETLERYAATLPCVTYVERNLFSCSEDSQVALRRRIEEEGLNRIVVAACSPHTHEALFRDTLKACGLNESLIEMANIRNHVSWVHASEPEAATNKAKDLVRMAAAKVALLEPLPIVSVNVNPIALVIGGGMAGMVTALGLADQGFPVHLVEKTSELGGNARHLFKTWKNESVPPFVSDLITRVKEHELITVHLRSRVVNAEGFVGNFRSTILKNTTQSVIAHGAAVIAIGGQAYKPDEYGYGQSQRVFTILEFDKLHQVGDERVKYGRSFAFIQCVGSRSHERPYCSRVCCTHAIQSAIALVEGNPERNVFVLYRDIRSFGQREELYRRARELGVIFINYEIHEKPEVHIRENELQLVVWDHVLHERVSLSADVLVLSTAIVPQGEVRELANLYKIPVDADGFLREAHVKLRPVDCATEGIFLAGLAHYPKPIEEAVAQAQAAVSRAVTVLSKRRIDLDPVRATVDVERCDGCALCLDVCPYHAITMEDPTRLEGKQRIHISAAKCKGCGICQATCPKEGVNVGGFTHRQLSAQIKAAMSR